MKSGMVIVEKVAFDVANVFVVVMLELTFVSTRA
jgi:hypothetical protein